MLIEERLEAARDHRAAGREDSAALLYESVLDAAPTNRDALKELADLKLNKGEIEDALRLARTAATQSTPDAEALAILAKGALAASKPEIALAALDQALEVDPHHAQACTLRADLHFQHGEYEAAESLLSRAIEHDPANPELLAALGNFYSNAGIHAPALDLVQQALARDPDRPELMALLGSLFARLGDHEKALAQFERAHLAQPGNPLIMAQLADTLCALGQLTEAQRLSRRCITLFDGFLPGWVSHVRVMVAQGRVKEGFAAFLPVARKHPDKVGSLLALAMCQRIAGYPEQALRLVEPLLSKLATLEPAIRAQIAMLARDCLLSLGRFGEIAGTFERDVRSVLGLPPASDEDGSVGNGAGSPGSDLAHALERASLVVDSGLSSLEAVALLRFKLKRDTADAVTTVHCPPELHEIAALVDHADARSGLPREPSNPALPLSMILALSPSQRGDIGARVPYITPSAQKRALWRRSLADLPRPVVALAWDSGRPGLMLEDYRAVFDGFDGTLLAVMWDGSRHQLAEWPEIIDGGVHFRSLADLVAAIAEADAIVGPDGIPLHVAGAMGHPGILLTMPSTPWYWCDEGGKSVWYPSISVLRAPAFGHWQEGLPDLAGRIRAVLDALGSGYRTRAGTARDRVADELAAKV